MMVLVLAYVCLFKQQTAYEMRISDWSSDVCPSDLSIGRRPPQPRCRRRQALSSRSSACHGPIVADACREQPRGIEPHDQAFGECPADRLVFAHLDPGIYTDPEGVHDACRGLSTQMAAHMRDEAPVEPAHPETARIGRPDEIFRAREIGRAHV